jgi:hypothetical protein
LIDRKGFKETTNQYITNNYSIQFSIIAVRHSREGGNPESVRRFCSMRLDARLRGHDEKNTPTPELNI